MKPEDRNSNPDTPLPPAGPFILHPSSFILGLVLAAVTLLAYLPVWRCDYVLFDDADYVTDNPMVQAGLTWAGVKWAFTTFHSSNWHPLTWLSHLLDVSLFGPGPLGPHLVNLSLHVVNTLLLFLLLHRFTHARWRSALVAALFALHPLHVESVAWVAERKDVLSAFFFMLTLWAYARYVSDERQGTNIQHPTSNIQHPMPEAADRGPQSAIGNRQSAIWYGCALGFFALGLLSKPMLVTLPFVLLLLDYWLLGRMGEHSTFNIQHSTSKEGPGSGDCPVTHPAPRTPVGNWGLVITEKLPFFILSVLSCAVTFAAQKSGGTVRSLTSFPIGERIGNALVAYAQYLGKLFWPVDLAIFYPHPGQWPRAQVALAAVLVAGLCLAVMWRRRRFPFAATGWFWFLGMLVPVIGLVQVSNQSLADRYTYLPSIGVFIMLAWGAGELLARWRVPKGVIATAAGLVLAACALRTADQLRHWRDAGSLFRHALAVTDRNFVAHNNLGIALLKQGDGDGAIEQFQKTVAIQPRYADAWCNLGSALVQKGRTDAAIGQFRKALEFQPGHALAGGNLATALLQTGRMTEAIAQFQQTLQVRPDDVPARLGFGNALFQAGRLDEALTQYEKVLEIQPGHADACNNLGTIRLRQGRWDEAIRQFQRALAIQPRHADAHNNLANVFLQQERWDQAITHYQQALAFQAGNADTHNNLANALLQLGRVDEAVVHLQKALALRPDFAEAHSNLGYVLLEAGRAREATEHLQEALKLQPDNPRTLASLAWVLATCPETSIRNGTRAVELATRANQLAGGRDPLILRSLAAARAEAGRFAEALAAARQALQLTEAQPNAMLADMLRSEIEFYQAGKPVRERQKSE